VAGDFPSETISNKYSLDTIDGAYRATAGAAQAPARDQPVAVRARAFILLSTYNGEAYVQELLDSLLAQTHPDWVLYWRDDGSSDGTVAIVENFRDLVGDDRCIRHLGPNGRLGPAGSFMTLLRVAAPKLRADDVIAFADQDDIWLPDTLQRGLTALADMKPGVPALYCASLVVVDAELRRLGETLIHPDRCGFPASLTQNVAAGCTILLNRDAVFLVCGSNVPSRSVHDWWCYLVVTAAGGRVLVDDRPVALYRQHDSNCIGVAQSKTRRAVAAVRRGPRAFMNILRQHVDALVGHPDLAGAPARESLMQLQQALQGGVQARLMALRLPDLKRQTWQETLLFRIWFLIG
jgi:hypothetical protein